LVAFADGWFATEEVDELTDYLGIRDAAVVRNNNGGGIRRQGMVVI
jgi:hypothetical protein